MRERLLFHVQHFLGMGHLIRAFTLAEELAKTYEVVIASGGLVPPGSGGQKASRSSNCSPLTWEPTTNSSAATFPVPFKKL